MDFAVDLLNFGLRQFFVGKLDFLIVQNSMLRAFIWGGGNLGAKLKF